MSLGAVPFDEAIGYAESRGIELPQVYYSARPGEARAAAFSIANIARIDTLRETLDSLNDALREGLTFEQWKRDTLARGISLGLPEHRLDNIFRTNIQAAYGSGRWVQQSANLGRKPYLLYDAINDSRVRPAHLAMDGFIARHDDPVWRRWYPPCGYRCRCTVISLTEAQAKARGYPSAQPAVEPDEGWAYDRRAGFAETMAAAERAVIAKAPEPIRRAAERAALDRAISARLWDRSAAVLAPVAFREGMQTAAGLGLPALASIGVVSRMPPAIPVAETAAGAREAIGRLAGFDAAAVDASVSVATPVGAVLLSTWAVQHVAADREAAAEAVAGAAIETLRAPAEVWSAPDGPFDRSVFLRAFAEGEMVVRQAADGSLLWRLLGSAERYRTGSPLFLTVRPERQP